MDMAARNPLDMDLVRTFLVVAETLHFTRAAERLGRTQSAVSLQVKRLEDNVGARLLRRSNREVRLTPEGEKLQRYARAMLRLQDETLAALGHPSTRGHVRLGVTDNSMCYLEPVLRRFAADHPLVEVEFRCDRSWHSLDALAAGEVDIALVTQDCGRKGGIPARREPLVWAAARGAAPERVDPLPLALFGTGCIYRGAAEKALAAAGRAYRHAYSSASRDGLNLAVDAGLAVTIVPEGVMPANWRRLGPDRGFPALPDFELLLFRSQAEVPRAAEALAGTILAVLGGPSESRQPGASPDGGKKRKS